MTKYMLFYLSLQCGKTYISNILGDATESNGGEYHPTHGVRILEFDVDGKIVGDVVRVAVELWDCGGSTQSVTAIYKAI